MSLVKYDTILERLIDALSSDRNHMIMTMDDIQQSISDVSLQIVDKPEEDILWTKLSKIKQMLIDHPLKHDFEQKVNLITRNETIRNHLNAIKITLNQPDHIDDNDYTASYDEVLRHHLNAIDLLITKSGL